MCGCVGKRGLGSEAETRSGRPDAERWCGACGAPVVNDRCSRDADECWERSQMKRNLDGEDLPVEEPARRGAG